MRRPTQYAPPRTIAVDVDGTLIVHDVLNTVLVEWCHVRKGEGYTLILWSQRGERYARGVVREWRLDGLFDHIISKPGYIVDDKGRTWIRDTKVIQRLKL